uniref:Uncharacterized protein n=1 Tax=Arundo donax TaxID=35708 RepID=A0A0A8ZHQ3_ARUDO
MCIRMSLLCSSPLHNYLFVVNCFFLLQIICRRT